MKTLNEYYEELVNLHLKKDNLNKKQFLLWGLKTF